MCSNSTASPVRVGLEGELEHFGKLIEYQLYQQISSASESTKEAWWSKDA